MTYPVTFEADYSDRRDRLTAFFRLILAIPLFIYLYVFGIAAAIAVIIAWFAIVITGRYPQGLYDFLAGFNRVAARMTAYTVLLCDPYPPFGLGDDPSYPVRMQFAGPLPDYSRLKTFFRFILAIPILIVRYVLGLLIEIGAIFAWFVIVITGKLPRDIFDLMVLGNSYVSRSDSYLLLLTETYPPFQDEQTRTAGVGGEAPAALSGAAAVAPADTTQALRPGDAQ